MDIKVETISIQSLLPYLEHHLSEKYSSCLFALSCKIHSFYRSLEQLYSLFSEIYQLPSGNQVLVSNCLNLLNQLISEQPSCLQLDFCVNFLDTINQNLNHLQANFHPIKHQQNLGTQIKKRIQVVENSFPVVYELVLQIQRKAIVCVPILKFIEETVRVFRKPVKMWIEGSKELRGLGGEARYLTVFNEFMEGIELTKRPQNVSIIKQMIQLIKDCCYFQLQLESLLSLPILLAHLLKNKGKKLLNEDIKAEQLALLLKYVNVLIRPDLIQRGLQGVRGEELAEAVRLMGEQKVLVEEGRRERGELVAADEAGDLQVVFEKWSSLTSQIKSLQTHPLYLQSLSSSKQSLSLSTGDLRRLSDSLSEFQSYLLQKAKLTGLQEKMGQHVQRLMLREFGKRVHLDCRDEG